MEELDLPIESTMTQVETPQEVTVDLTPTGPTYVRGMEPIVVDRVGDKERQGYTATYLRCKRCQAEVSQENDESVVCPTCKDTEFQIYDRIHGDKVGAIINKQTMYKCRECGARYEDPNRQCCAYNHLFTKKEAAISARGFQCLGCFAIYRDRFDCCSGKKMISGQFVHESQAYSLGV